MREETRNAKRGHGREDERNMEGGNKREKNQGGPGNERIMKEEQKMRDKKKTWMSLQIRKKE